MEDNIKIRSKTEILIGFYNTAQAQLLENEINIRTIQRSILIEKPGEVYANMNKTLIQKKANKEAIEKAMAVMKEMIEEENKNAKTVSVN